MTKYKIIYDVNALLVSTFWLFPFWSLHFTTFSL